MHTKLIGTCLAVVVAGGCSSGGGTPGQAPAPDASAQVRTAARPSRDVISRDELADPEMSTRSVLEVIRALRPHFLTVRGTHTLQDTATARRGVVDQEAGKVHASIDGSKIVSVDELVGINASNVIEIRYLSPSQAMQRFGGAAREGPVILVKTM